MNKDVQYLRIIVDCIRVCGSYTPKFGQGRKEGLTLEEFQDLYRKDPFYGWFGLDNPMMYAAHKAAGGITIGYDLGDFFPTQCGFVAFRSDQGAPGIA